MADALFCRFIWNHIDSDIACGQEVVLLADYRRASPDTQRSCSMMRRMFSVHVEDEVIKGISLMVPPVSAQD